MRRGTPLMLLGVLSPLAGCAHTALEARVRALEQTVAVLQASLAQPTYAPGRAPTNEAAELYQAAVDNAAQGLVEESRALLRQLFANHPESAEARTGRRLYTELSVVGTRLDALPVTTWYQGHATLDDAPLTALVFWEVWCPHCARDVPAMEGRWQDWKDRGLMVVGITRRTRDVTVEQVEAFVRDHGISFPIGHDDGQLTETMAVSGLPAAVVIRDQRVIWRGHPNDLFDERIDAWLAPAAPAEAPPAP